MRARCRVFVGILAVVCSVSVSAQLLDTTPPVITPQVSGTASNGWYTTDVGLHWDVVDDESLITVKLGCDDNTILSDIGVSVFTCTAISLGGTASVSVSIGRDTTPPSVTYGNNAGTYNLNQTIAISCNAFDALSGVASHDCAPVNGLAYTVPLGTNTRSASATDNAGNSGSGSTSFAVAVTYDGVIGLVDLFTTKKTVARNLKRKLQTARKAEQQGDISAEQKARDSFIDQVNRERERTITSPNADLLIQFAQML